MAEKHADKKKPLTAFKKSEVMLNKDPDRHIRLMPMQFEFTQFTQPENTSLFSASQRQLNISQAPSSLVKFGETAKGATR